MKKYLDIEGLRAVLTKVSAEIEAAKTAVAADAISTTEITSVLNEVFTAGA